MADILIVHDQGLVRQSLLEHVSRGGHTATCAASFHEALSGGINSTRAEYGVVLAGTRSGERAKDVIHQAKTEWPTAEVVIIGDSTGLADATEAVRHGAYDFLTVSAISTRLHDAVRGASQRHRTAEDQVRPPVDDVDDALPLDPVTRAVFQKADRIAGVNSPVLITGESGTGKEVLARRIHRHSAQRRQKFVPINTASLPETLIESELFGHKRGAFTGAVCDAKGLIEEASGGTLFLDEIGDMPLLMQVRLLRFLDCGEVRAIGGTATKYVDVRVISATNRCLGELVSEKQFREDLFFRLNVIALHLPPLRERRADIPSLIQHHTRHIAAKLNRPVPEISTEAMALLVNDPWPGNIRELRNALEHAIAQQPGRRIAPKDLPESMLHGGPIRVVARGLDTREVVSALQMNNGNVARTAAKLGVSRTTLWRRLRQLDSPPARARESEA